MTLTTLQSIHCLDVATRVMDDSSALLPGVALNLRVLVRLLRVFERNAVDIDAESFSLRR